MRWPWSPSVSDPLLVALAEQNKRLIEQNLDLVDRLRVLVARQMELPEPSAGPSPARTSRTGSLPMHDPAYWRSDEGAETVDEAGILQVEEDPEDVVRRAFAGERR